MSSSQNIANYLQQIEDAKNASLISRSDEPKTDNGDPVSSIQPHPGYKAEPAPVYGGPAREGRPFDRFPGGPGGFRGGRGPRRPRPGRRPPRRPDPTNYYPGGPSKPGGFIDRPNPDPQYRPQPDPQFSIPTPVPTPPGGWRRPTVPVGNQDPDTVLPSPDPILKKRPGDTGERQPNERQQRRQDRMFERNFEKTGDVGADVIGEYYDRRTGRTVRTPSSNYQPKNDRRFKKIEGGGIGDSRSPEERGRDQYGPSVRERMQNYRGRRNSRSQGFKDRYMNSVRDRMGSRGPQRMYPF